MRRGDIFLAIAVPFQLEVGFGLRRVGAGLIDFFRTVTAPGFFRVGAGLLEGSLQFLVVKRNQDLARLDGIAFADQNFVDAAADLGADADIAGFDGARTLQRGVAVEPASIKASGGEHGGRTNKNQDELAVHRTNLHT